MTIGKQQTEYEGLPEIEKLMVVCWSPDGYYGTPMKIDVNNIPANTTLYEAISEARKRKPKQRIITAGEWHTIRNYLQKTNPEAEENMVRDPRKMTSTILDYGHGKRRKNYFAGLLIQMPEVNDEGNLLTDENGILKAKQIWEMPLPIGFYNLKELTKTFDKFLNTVYGTEDARKKFPEARIKASDHSFYGGDLSLGVVYCADDSFPGMDERRLNIDTIALPLRSKTIAAQAIEDGRIIKLDDADLENIKLLVKGGDVPVGGIEKFGNTLEKIFSKPRENQPI